MALDNPLQASMEMNLAQVIHKIEVLGQFSVAEIDLLHPYLKDFEGFISVEDISSERIYKPLIKVAAMKGGEMRFCIWLYKEKGNLTVKEILPLNQISALPVPRVKINEVLTVSIEGGTVYQLKIVRITRGRIFGEITSGPDKGKMGAILYLEENNPSYFCGKERGLIESIT